MIQKVPGYKYPNAHEIDLACEALGYNLYVPKKVLQDIIYINVYHSKRQQPVYYRAITEFEKLYVQFLKNLHLTHSNNTPLMNAIATLKLFSDTLDYRKMENGEINYEEFSNNFKSDITSEQEELAIILSGKTDIHDLAEILEMGIKISESLGMKDKEISTVSNRMTSIKDVFSVRYSEWLKPLFKHKVINKSFEVEKEVENPKLSDTLIYCEDDTASMMNNPKLLAATRWAILNSKKDVIVYSVTSDCIQMSSITDVNRDNYVFGSGFFKEDCDYGNMLKILNTYDFISEAILVTDGQNYVPNMKMNMKINCVTNVANPRMRNLVKRSGGKYLIL